MNKAQTYSTWIVVLLFGLCVVPLVSAESVPSLDVPYYSQNVGEWSTEQLGSNSFLIRDSGCALTSTAMVFAYYGLDVNPSILNTWLKVHDGYDEQGNIGWKTAAEFSTIGNIQTITLDETNDVKIWASTRDSPFQADLNVINDYLRSGYPVLAKVWYSDFNYDGGWHWVVLTGYSTIGGSTVYTIRDPFLDYSNIYGPSAATIPDQRFYERKYGGAAGAIYGIVVFKGMPPKNGLIAGNDLIPRLTDDVSTINSTVVPSLSSSIPFEETVAPLPTQDVIPQYSGLIGPGTIEDISMAVLPVPASEAETENKTQEVDPSGEYNRTTNWFPYTASYPQEYHSLVFPDLSGSASWEDAWSEPVILLPTVPTIVISGFY